MLRESFLDASSSLPFNCIYVSMVLSCTPSSNLSISVYRNIFKNGSTTFFLNSSQNSSGNPGLQHLFFNKFNKKNKEGLYVLIKRFLLKFKNKIFQFYLIIVHIIIAMETITTIYSMRKKNQSQ